MMLASISAFTPAAQDASWEKELAESGVEHASEFGLPAEPVG
jgi:hypothetical protein